MTATPKRLLLVEDDENDLELTLTALEKSHLANGVDVARDGEEALEYLERRGRHAGRAEADPVVVLLDIKLPRVDGLEVLQRMRESPQLRVVPVVMLTSSREERDIVRSYGLGVNAYVVKPVEFAEFMTAIRELGLFWAVINQPPPRAPDAAP